MTYSEQYLLAAESVFNKEEFCCIAMEVVGDKRPLSFFNTPIARYFSGLFDDQDESLCNRIGNIGAGGQELRVMLLCMAAAVARSEGK